MKLVKNENQKNTETVSDKEAEEAFIKSLNWMGEDPGRECLLETPKRVIKAYDRTDYTNPRVIAELEHLAGEDRN